MVGTKPPPTPRRKEDQIMVKRNTRHRKSPEQRAAEAQALHDTLTAQVENLTETGEWQRFLEFSRSFHDYSLNNLLLILAQKPDATQVAGFRQWQAKGRQVRKGEKAIRIRGFSTKKINEEDPETGEEIHRELHRFPTLSVFDISQSDPIEGAEPVPAPPVQTLTGDDPGGIYDAMATHMTAQGWTITREAIPGEVNGYTTRDGTRRIAVDEALEPAQAAKTMLHEAAHATLHARDDADVDGAAEHVAHRGLRECEAESVAYVLAGLVGLDTSAYSIGYIATWTGGDLEMIRSTAATVLTGVHQLTPALLPDETDQAEHHQEGDHRAA